MITRFNERLALLASVVLWVGCAHSNAAPTTNAAPAASSAPTLSKGQIRATIRASREKFGACYIRALERGERAQGSVVAFFRILPDGRVEQGSPAIVRTTLNLPEVEACVLRELAPLVFPPPGEAATVRYPFIFELELEPDVSK